MKAAVQFKDLLPSLLVLGMVGSEMQLSNIHEPSAVTTSKVGRDFFRRTQTSRQCHPGSNTQGCFLEHPQTSEHFDSSGITFSAILNLSVFSTGGGFYSRGMGAVKRLTIAGGVKLVF